MGDREVGYHAVTRRLAAALLAAVVLLGLNVPTAATETTTSSVAVILVTFDGAQPWTPTQAASVATQVRDLYSQSSDGQLTLAPTVYGWYTIAPTCLLSGIRDEARAAANVTADHYVYVFPRQDVACGWTWTGQSVVSGVDSWLNGVLYRSILTHELGHQLGLMHATSATSEYGDFWSPMGAADTVLDAWERHRAGWLAVTPMADGINTLAALGTTAPNRLLVLDRGDGTYLAADQPSPTQVVLRIVRECVCNTVVVNTRPDIGSGSLAPLTVGRSWQDPVTGNWLSLVSADANGAVLQLGATPATTTTTTTTRPPVTTTTAPPTTTTTRKKKGH